MIVTRAVTVQIGRAILVREVSLEVAVGEVVALVGPNGAGKSTLLSVMAGDRPPTRGEVLLAGRTLASWPAAALARRRAVLPQASDLAAAFTALEVVMLGQDPGDERLRRVRALRRLEQLGLAALAGRSYPTLSGGEQQRVQLARVLEQLGDDGGRVLLLDEPTASLDPRHQHQVLAMARRAARDDHAVAVVLHDLSLAAQYADRIAVLHRGALVACGLPSDALDPALLGEVFAIDFEVVAHQGGRPILLALPRREPDPDGTTATGSSS